MLAKAADDSRQTHCDFIVRLISTQWRHLQYSLSFFLWFGLHHYLWKTSCSLAATTYNFYPRLVMEVCCFMLWRLQYSLIVCWKHGSWDSTTHAVKPICAERGEISLYCGRACDKCLSLHVTDSFDRFQPEAAWTGNKLLAFRAYFFAVAVTGAHQRLLHGATLEIWVKKRSVFAEGKKKKKDLSSF